ncbi:MAG: hypothetical protein A2W98_06305 [Bacteroidetes bacterium GWF2_33_38]|nr:MAG: hypothetical protein A2W98_06305 [Bacteroidetes bacterium GWF2_33_38]OFY85980.1 MAG: hypothetical protein A2236_00810 [Bacteroidetes bacterium RIFOXYA2_FULL_33_7]
MFSLFSCTSYKKVTYLREAVHDEDFQLTAAYEIYKIQKKDILYIQIVSLSEEVNNLFNVNNGKILSTYNEQYLYLHSFSVNDSGYVVLPIIGEVKVLDLSIEEAHKAIQLQADQFLKDASVIVKLLSFKISILGEVNNPGHFNVYQNHINIMEALSIAGDIGDYGNKQNVLLIRHHANSTKTYRLDLTDKQLITSEFIYLLPNDVIYVEPLKAKAFRQNAPNISIVLTSISTIILVLNFILK